MPARWVSGAPVLWADLETGFVEWVSDIPIPPPEVLPTFPPETPVRRPPIPRRLVIDRTPVPEFPARAPWAAPTLATYRIEVRNIRTGLVKQGCLLVDGMISAEYGRTLDDGSSASVTVTAPDSNPGCVECVPAMWEDELVFFRDTNPEPVWQGPIVSVSDSVSELTILAVDRSANFGDRRATITHPAFAEDAVPSVNPLDLVRWIIDQAELVGGLGLRVMRPAVGQVPLVTAQIAAGDLLFDALSDLAGDTIDWAVVGTRFYFGCPTVTLPPLPTLDTRLHWSENGASIERDGRAIAHEVEVIGGAGRTVRYAGPSSRLPGSYRPLRLIRERLTSEAHLRQIAKDVWAESQVPTVIVMADPSLSPDAPVAVEDLIPGRVISVFHDRGSRSVRAMQRLTAVTVSVSSGVDHGGWALMERAVNVELEPALRRLVDETL